MKVKAAIFFSVEMFVLVGVITWLFFAAATVDVEPYDGLETICNARYFLGESDVYIISRAPLMGIVMTGAEFVKDHFALHPLEVRPHHFCMALFHSAYIILVYVMLVRFYKRSLAVLIAFITAILNFIFFSYAPFISHDIFAGILFLNMIFLSHDFVERPTLRSLSLLIILGSCAALIKHMFGIFWVVILMTQGLLTLFCAKERKKHVWKSVAYLAGGTVISGLITWTVLGCVLKGFIGFEKYPLFLRPYYQIIYTLSQYNGHERELFPWWVLVRNFWAYGHGTLLCIIPGIILAFKKERIYKLFALSWLLSFIIIQVFVTTLEVRYIAFLAPLSAFLIVPVIQWLFRRRIFIWIIISFLIFDLMSVIPVMGCITDRFFICNPQKEFFGSLTWLSRKYDTLLINEMFPFISPVPIPLVGDRYYGLFHIGYHHIGILYTEFAKRISRENVHVEENITRETLHESDKAIVAYVNTNVVNSITWTYKRPLYENILYKWIGVTRRIKLQRIQEGLYTTDEGKQCTIEESSIGDKMYNLLKLDNVCNIKTGYVTGIYVPTQNKWYDIKAIDNYGNFITEEAGKNMTEENVLYAQVVQIERDMKDGIITVYPCRLAQ